MKRTLALLTLVATALVVAAPLAAQTRLSIVDALPPYLLSARLLDNGHFSITTKYTGEPKTLIYQEDGSGGPINYTSHVHFKVDDVIFQLPFELNPATREAPPEHPLTITALFRDTVSGTARVNARMFGVMPDGDTIRFLFTMHPVKRPSGGFVRMLAEVTNTTSRPRSVGVLMLVDTKIGDNDRAPIITAFGYRSKETEYERAVAPGMPEYWLALEGTPTDPRLTARGNVRASGLIEPDYVLMGNWKDNTSVPGAIGMASVIWDERRAFDVDYTDSAVLLRWEEQTMAPGERRLRASTEIGIVDSLDVSRPVIGEADLWLVGSGLANSCLGFDVVRENPCGAPGYFPYAPDSLQALYIVTNSGLVDADNVRLVVPSVPAGLAIDVRSNPVIPTTLGAGTTGVATLAIRPLPRLTTKTFAVPLAVVGGVADTLRRDTICVVVPGLLGEIEAEPAAIAPLCPGLSDTIDVRVRLDGPRCLPLVPDAELIGSPAEVAQFEIVAPKPAVIPADGVVTYRVRYTAGPVGTRPRVGLVVRASDNGLDDLDRETTVIIADTAEITGESMEAEFRFADVTDTLDLGAICVGDTTLGDWTISNVGGCELTIDRAYSFENDPLGQFSVFNDAELPMTIGRDRDSIVTVRFTPRAEGVAIARFIIRGTAAPFVDTLIVRGRGDVPRLEVEATAIPDDTLCPGERFSYSIDVVNPTACDVTVTSVTTDAAGFTVDFTREITLAARSRRQVRVSAASTTPGRYATRVTITGGDGSAHAVDVAYVVAERALAHDAAIAFGDVRLGSSPITRRVTITSTGTAPATIGALRLTGANTSEYSIALPNGESLPMELAPSATLAIDVTFAPSDLESRRARLVIETGSRGVCAPDGPIELEGRGVMPLLDVPKRRLALGRRCAGVAIDTTIELRNLGNAPLTVTGIEAMDGNDGVVVAAAGLPLEIAPDSTRSLRLTIAPDRLGQFELALRVQSDGRWFTEPDTLVQIVGTGVLCATISADTVRGRVGESVKVPVRIAANGLSGADVARLINDAGVTGMSLTMRHDATVARFEPIAPVDGMLAGMSGVAVTTASAAVRLDAPDGGGALAPGTIIGTLEAEILLGTTDRTVLDLEVTRFAGGWAELVVNDGLILADWCALDRRYVSVSGLLIAATSTPLPPDGALVVRVPSSVHATVTLYDELGRAVATLADEVIDDTRSFGIGDAGSGVYTAVVRTVEGVASARVIVAR